MSTFTGFKERRIPVHSDVVGDLEIYAKVGGSGAGLLLIHGYPQCHQHSDPSITARGQDHSRYVMELTGSMWNKVAGQLSEKYTVVCADLRDNIAREELIEGYGKSSKPPGSSTHVEYSKRELANDLVQLMSHFKFEKFNILAHDRGARVAHRLALDHPGKVEKVVLLDIAPTLWMYEQTDMAFATGYWHWFFLIQPSPQVEEFILTDPKKYWGMLSSRGSHTGVKWSEEDVAMYQEGYFTKEGIHAACEDYRASATIDLEHDRENLKSNNKLAIPHLKIIWGEKGIINTLNNENVKAIWEGYCGDKVELTAQRLGCGHYIAEERPEELLAAIDGYFD